MTYFAKAAAGAAVLIALLLLAVVYRVLRAAHTTPQGAAAPHEKSGFDRAVLSQVTRTITRLVRVGVRLGPVMMLTVPGRTSGEPRTTPVDLFEQNGRYWLVATHDATADWVQNLRAAGEGSVSRGRRRYAFTAAELSPQEADAVLQDVLGPRLARPVGGFVLRRTLAVPADAPPDGFVANSAAHPVFELTMHGDREQETPVLATRRSATVPALAIIAGALIASGHLALGVAGIMTTTQWASGVISGLLVAGIGNHLRIFGRWS